MKEFKLSLKKERYEKGKVFGTAENSKHLFIMINNFLITYLENKDYVKYDAGIDLLTKIVTDYKAYKTSMNK